MLKINVSTAEAVVTETELITAGRKGLQCEFTFNSAWDGLQKTAVFMGVVTRDLALIESNTVVVPAECIAKAQFPLKIGVYGALADGTIAIPTIWTNFGKVLPGTKPSYIPPDELTPDIVAQIMGAASDALYLARNVQSMADSGQLDGVSPAVTITSITGGHNVNITDRDHPTGQDFNVMDGVGVPSGGTTGQVLKKSSETDYDTEWANESGGGSSYDDTWIRGEKSYTTLFGGEFSVTTASGDYAAPSARASVTGRLPKTYQYRVTVNGVKYELPCRLACFTESSTTSKAVEYVGNPQLYGTDFTSGLTHEIDNVPFLIVSDLNDSGSIDVFTSTAGTYTILVERINVTGTVINNYPIYGTAYDPIEVAPNSGTYCGVSIGPNKLTNTRGTFAVGLNNTCAHEFTYAIGDGNTVSGADAFSEGFRNTASGPAAHAEGAYNTSSGYYAHTEGAQNVASGNYSHAQGRGTIAAKSTQHVFGKWNIEDTTEGGYGYAEIVGNGTATDARSNARTLDWNGNEVLAGKLTLGAAPTANMDAATKQYVDSVIPSADIEYFEFVVDDINDMAVTPGTGVTTSAIFTAHAAGKTCFAKITFEDANGEQILPLTFAYDGTTDWIEFAGGFWDGSGGNPVALRYLGTTGWVYEIMGYVNRNQGTINAGKFLVVGNDGYVTTMTLSTWQGGNY